MRPAVILAPIPREYQAASEPPNSRDSKPALSVLPRIEAPSMGKIVAGSVAPPAKWRSKNSARGPAGPRPIRVSRSRWAISRIRAGLLPSSGASARTLSPAT
ncbi:hypothetical protein FBR05_11975 [Deltaproteobacteria bacterium PRO3]|nr:hypothetical protein [Deltaproteobacteria bacterium PRO3]